MATNQLTVPAKRLKDECGNPYKQLLTAQRMSCGINCRARCESKSQRAVSLHTLAMFFSLKGL